jgi:hypothetical protein
MEYLRYNSDNPKESDPFPRFGDNQEALEEEASKAKKKADESQSGKKYEKFIYNLEDVESPRKFTELEIKNLVFYYYGIIYEAPRGRPYFGSDHVALVTQADKANKKSYNEITFVQNLRRVTSPRKFNDYEIQKLVYYVYKVPVDPRNIADPPKKFLGIFGGRRRTKRSRKSGKKSRRRRR